MRENDDITELLNAANSGDAGAQQSAYALIYEELKRCARRQRRIVPGSSLSPTALVSELYLRLNSDRIDRIHNRGHFFALAARAMRQIVVDHARKRASAKRGAGLVHTDLASLDVADASAEQALELDAALTTLAGRDSRLAELVEWHFFAGLTFGEIAGELGRHERTVRRDWELARACLQQIMATPPVPAR
ncbi:MAG: ECF-type sigma factor [Rhodanobacteraceae bacterium]